MRPLPILLVLTLALSSLAWAKPPAATQPLLPGPAGVVEQLFAQGRSAEPQAAPPQTTEDAAFNLARDLLEQGGYATAAASFDEFLEKYPRSKRSAEALYRLQVARWLLGDTVRAVKARRELLDQHPDSPWSRLMIRQHLDEGTLRDYARELRDKAHRSRQRDDAVRAAAVLRQYYERFPRGKGQMTPAETFYLVAACEQIAGGEAMARDMLDVIGKAVPKDSLWRTLTALRLGDAQAFAAELPKFTFDDRESAYLLLDLLEKHEAQLDNADLARGQYLRGRALLMLKRKPEGREALARFLDEHPAAVEAPDALFRLADSLYADRKVDEAAARYRQFAALYPAETHARRLRRWAGWLKHEKEDWADLTRTLVSVAGQFRDAGDTFAVTLEGGPVAKDEPVRVRLAFEGRKRFLMDVKAGEVGFLLTSSERGACVFNRQERAATRSTQQLDAALPGLRMSRDQATGKYNQLGFGCGDEGVPGEPALNVPDAAAEHFIEGLLRPEFHLRRRERAGEGITYRLESAGVESGSLLVVGREVDAPRKFRALRIDHLDEKGERSKWSLKDVHFGGPLPDELFAVKLPRDTKVRRVEKLSPLSLWVQWMTLFDRLGEEVGSAGRAMLGAARGALGR